LYLSFATATTVGYGDVSPRTDAGKALTCAYALLSISVTGQALAAWGDFCQNAAVGVWDRAERVYAKVLAKVLVKRIIDAFQDLTGIDARSASKLQYKLQ